MLYAQDDIIRSELPCYLANRDSWEKSGNLKIDQKVKEKSGNFIKLTDWQSPIE